MLFIVSTVELKPWVERPGLGAHVDEEDEIAVTVVEAQGGKCDRCWRYSETVGQFEEHPDLASGAIRL